MCKKMTCQPDSQGSSRTTCEVGNSDDGTFCSQPGIRGVCDAGDKCDGAGTCVVDGSRSYDTGKVCRPSAEYCDSVEECEFGDYDCPNDVDNCPGDSGGGRPPKRYSPHSPYSPHSSHSRHSPHSSHSSHRIR
eukprot:GHVN01006811.1.p2 GENE.GHVN01006811.1~~GHVN01006811.1.p2  ORF type:complete len:133 (+),score=40.19 GHVN01006811.1:529-927(+)